MRTSPFLKRVFVRGLSVIMIVCATGYSTWLYVWCATPPLTSDGMTSAFVSYDPSTAFKDVVRSSSYLTMRDGVKIAFDLYLPKGLAKDTRIPTILHQTRYWRSMRFRWPANIFMDNLEAQGRLGRFKKFFICHGYAWVDVDARGSGASFGSRCWDYSPDEVQDGAEVVNWIVRQSWSDGNVGSAGASYSGCTAEFLLVNRHPAVKGCTPLFSEFDQYTDIIAPGGVPQQWYFDDWGRTTGLLDRNQIPINEWKAKLFVGGVRPVDEDPGRRLLREAVREHTANYDFRSLKRVTCRDDTPLSDEERNSPEKRKALERAFAYIEKRFGKDPLTMGMDIASQHAYKDDIDASGAPEYAYSGWFDGALQHAAIKRFLTLKNPGNKLIIGPWDHAMWNISPYSARGPSRFAHEQELLKFVDYYVRGFDTGLVRDKRVHYFTMGEECWKAADTWPPKSTALSYYLRRGNLLDTNPAEDEKSVDTYQVDYSAGTGRQTRWNTLMGEPLKTPYPDRVEQDRKLLVYTSAPLDKDTEVTGHPVVTLHIASSATDGAFFAYLEDVDGQGNVTYVTEGMLRALHRKISPNESNYVDPVPRHAFTRAETQLLTPNQVAELVFDLLPTSYQFKKGHSIRVALAGADKDHFALIPPDVSPTWKVFLDRDRPSRIELPIVTQF